jgi:hypothetical protein
MSLPGVPGGTGGPCSAVVVTAPSFETENVHE